jgi:hypothetical protein
LLELPETVEVEFKHVIEVAGLTVMFGIIVFEVTETTVVAVQPFNGLVTVRV